MSQSVLTLLAVLALAAPALVASPVPAAPHPVPEAAAGFAIAPLAAVGVTTAMTFGPGDHVYVATLQGDVLRVEIDWTPAGPVALGTSVVASGFSQPLGLAFDAAGALYVADSEAGAESRRTDGRVTRVADGESTVIVSGLPNGRHNTNNLRFGPDGRLYIANGNPNDSGKSGGDPDVFPYSGAILSVDVAEVAASPAVLRWRANGAAIPAAEIASHPLNADFAAKVRVLAHGFRNVYDIAFSPAGVAYTATNGADSPASQDLVYRITPGTDYGFPFCYNIGTPGGTGAAVTVEPNPVYGDAARCADTPPATALLGWHVCATGLDFPTEGPAGFRGAFGNSLYVAECGPFFANSVVTASAGEPAKASYNTGHKIARVALDADGHATGVTDFITGLALPTDVVFGPDGAMYVADVEAIWRVVQLPEPAGALAAGLPADPVAAAGPGAWLTTYATPLIAVEVGGALRFRNLDVMKHDIVAVSAVGADDRSWCELYAPGTCPAFWTKLIGLNQETSLEGADQLEAGGVYEFTCSLHENMRGALVALPKVSDLLA